MKLTKEQEARLNTALSKPTFDEMATSVKACAANELSLQLSKIIQIAEGMKTDKPNKVGIGNYDSPILYWYDVARNDALSDLISTLTTLQEEK